LSIAYFEFIISDCRYAISSLLLSCISPVASDVSGMIQVDRMTSQCSTLVHTVVEVMPQVNRKWQFSTKLFSPISVNLEPEK